MRPPLQWRRFFQRISMYKYKLWVRVNEYQTAFTIIYAENDYAAKLLGEAQYGIGNVLSYTKEES
jgi:hypothetical protein